jgi:hypothetical protein
LIPSDNDLTMDSFLDFYSKRRAALKTKLMNLLDVKVNQESISEDVLVEEETID